MPDDRMAAGAAPTGGSDGGAGRRSRAPGRLPVLLALFIAALALRPQIVGLGPLLPGIQRDLDIPHAVAGLLSTIPIVCMGVFAPLTPVIVGRWGTRRVVTMCLVGIGAFGIIRALAPGTLGLVLSTVCVGVPIGIGGAVLPVVVKERFADRPASATGVYASGITLGAAIAAGAAIPIAQAFGGWRAALAAFSIGALAIAVAWAGSRQDGSATPRGVRRSALPLRSRLAWVLAVLFALHSACFYGLNAWLVAFLLERGWAPDTAGSVLAVFNVSSLSGTIAVPQIADRFGSRRAYLTTSGAALTAAVCAIVVAPSVAGLAVVVGGVGLGVLFALGMTLPLDVAERPAQVGAVTGLMLGFGYGASAFAPMLLGAFRDATGNFTAPMVAIAAMSSGVVLLCLVLSPARLRAESSGVAAP